MGKKIQMLLKRKCKDIPTMVLKRKCKMANIWEKSWMVLKRKETSMVQKLIWKFSRGSLGHGIGCLQLLT
jgi:hypothetical protein